MKISDIVSDIDFICGSTSATYLTGDKERNINNAYHGTAITIWESDGAWNFDDSNNTDAPIATRTMGDASATYLVPTTAIQIRQVEVKDNQGDWFKLVLKNYEDLTQSPEEYYSSAGLPRYYSLVGNEIRLFPPPSASSTTLTSGLAVRLSRDVTELRISATTTTPGIPTAFHKILSYAASLDFLQDNKQREFLMLQKDRLNRSMVRFYAKRGWEVRSNIKPRGKRFWRQYE